MARPEKSRSGSPKHVSLKLLAEHLKLSPATVSAVLNKSRAAEAIPQTTHNRVHAAAAELGYRPNFFARTLRNKRTFTIGLLAQEIGDGYGSLVISGIESYLREHGYFFFTVGHHHDSKLLEEYEHLLVERGVEGFIAVDTELSKSLALPTVVVSGHRNLKDVTNIVLDHHRAAYLALKHLQDLGHSEIAFMKGQPFSSDSKDRWQAICDVAKKLGITIRPEWTVRLEEETSSPEIGCPATRKLLTSGARFTALFAYNDISAIGAIRALREAGIRVPEDVSVVGFDDIQFAEFHNPSLTTVRQPLRRMGEIAAETLIRRITDGDAPFQEHIAVEPALIVRESTAAVPKAALARKRHGA